MNNRNIFVDLLLVTKRCMPVIGYIVLAISVVGSIYAAYTYKQYNATRDFRNAPLQIKGCTDPGVTAIAYSIQTNPNAWEADDYKMWHGDDASVWIANSDYGLSITLGKSGGPDQKEMSDECRAVLYDATQSWARVRIAKKLRS